MAENFETVPDWLERFQDYKPKDLLGIKNNQHEGDGEQVSDGSNEEVKNTEKTEQFEIS